MPIINYELKPTEENIRKTFINNTSGRNEAIANFIMLLDNIECNTVIALDDAWGNGKTFFMKQLQMVLMSLKDKACEEDIRDKIQQYIGDYEIGNYIAIYYDAWTNDSDHDPILSIVYNLLQCVSELSSYYVSDSDWRKRIRSAFELVVQAVSGLDVKAFLDSLEGDDPFNELKKHKRNEQMLNGIFDAILEKQPNNTRIIFLVDELDRCRPDFAVKVLERIKHYFGHDDVIFILSVNSLELQHTIKKYYGTDFDASKYLNRFFDFSISMPSPDMDEFYSSLKFLSNARVREYTAKTAIDMYKFSMRDITRYIQTLSTIIPKQYSEHYKELGFYFEVLIPFMIGLKIYDITQYEEFIRGRNSEPFIKFALYGGADRYCHIFLSTGESFDESNGDMVKVSLKERFDELYKYLFTAQQQKFENMYGITIGDVKFTTRWKDMIMRVMNFMETMNNLNVKF